MSPLRQFHEATKSPHFQMWAYRILIMIGLLALLVLFKEQQDTTKDIKKQNAVIAASKIEQDRRAVEITIENCKDSRRLISDIILRSLNATYAEYLVNPGMVLARYRLLLEKNPAYQGNTQLIDSTIDRTRDILNASSPEKCVSK